MEFREFHKCDNFHLIASKSTDRYRLNKYFKIIEIVLTFYSIIVYSFRKILLEFVLPQVDI